MSENDKQIWKSTIEEILLENESWESKNDSERYNIVYGDKKMPPTVAHTLAYDKIAIEHPEVELKKLGGGVRTNQFVEELGFKVTEDLIYNSTDKSNLINHIDNRVKNKKLFQEFISFGYEVLDQLNIEVYKVRMAIESDGDLSVIIGMRAGYSYNEEGDYSNIGLLVSKDFINKNQQHYDFVYNYDYKGQPEQEFVKVKVQKWSEIDKNLLEEHKEQFRLQYNHIKDSKRTQWNVEAKTTSNALKYVMFKNENINRFMSDNREMKNVINISPYKIYKLSMGTFYKTTKYKKARLDQEFEKNRWAVMHESTAVNQGHNWVNQVNKGDYAYITFGQNKLSYLVKFISDSEKLPESITKIIGEEGYTYRKYEIIQKPLLSNTRNLVSDTRFWLPSGNSTLKEIPNLNEANKVLFGPYYNVEVINKNSKSNKLEESIKSFQNGLPLNQILYGPPGTGKTYCLQNEYFSKFIISEESLTTEQVHDNIAEELSWWQTFAIALRDLGESNTKEILAHPIVKAKERLSNAKSIHPILWSRLQAHTVSFCPNVNVKERSEPQVFFKSEDSKWSLDKEAVENLYPEVDDLLTKVKNPTIEINDPIKNFEFVTFHQAFTYEDFVEGIKPQLETGSNDITYEIKDGVFKQLANKAEKDPTNNYAIFIDEINRGNVASIFGELITLLEPDKRIDAVNEIKVKLPYSKTMFGVPSNLYVFGTMNTADRSVEALDSALRRRFSFREVMPNYKIVREILGVNNEWNGLHIDSILEKINKRIVRLIDRDHQIGHSYFLKLSDFEKDGITEGLKAIFSENIVPLLQEYFFNDTNKLGLVLGDGFLISEDNQENSDPLWAIFDGDGSNYEDDIFEIIDAKKMSDDQFKNALISLMN